MNVETLASVGWISLKVKSVLAGAYDLGIVCSRDDSSSFNRTSYAYTNAQRVLLQGSPPRGRTDAKQFICCFSDMSALLRALQQIWKRASNDRIHQLPPSQ
jgi:hypothetical protein